MARTTRSAPTSTPSSTELEAFEGFEATTWEERAGGYERFFAAITARTLDVLLDVALVGRGTRHLDVACGTGDTVGAAMARGATTTGIDVARAMVDLARRRWPGGDFRRADALELPFGDASFDAVTAGFVLMHLGRPEIAVREWVRVLAPGGRLAVTAWDERDRVSLFGELLDALDVSDATRPEAVPDGPDFFRFADEGELRTLLEGRGLESVTVSTLSLTHIATGAEEVWRGILDGTVRTAAAIRGQTPETRERVRARFTERLQRYAHDGRLELPISVKLAAGTVASRSSPV